MKTAELRFDYPESLIATSPQKVSRVMWVEGDESQETTISQLISRMRPEDVVVINETKVLKARVMAQSGLEILFVRNLGDQRWEVLCPARRWSKAGERLPCGTRLELERTGLPQIVKVDRELDFAYFEEHGQVPLPPYIQEKRGERQSRQADDRDYQTAWAKTYGSLAAPTASLHFKAADMDKIRARGLEILPLCLHVGLGTFLPIHADDLSQHQMHGEWVSIPETTQHKIMSARENGGRVWALGSTVLRALEAWQRGHLQNTASGAEGMTELFLKPGDDFKVVDVLMTNFHQPESTLLALVGAFAGMDNVMRAYQWAIAREFRLFSYGDLTVWNRK